MKGIFSYAPAWVWFLAMISGLHFFGIRVSEDNFYQIVLGRYIAAHGLPHELPFTVHAAEHLHYMVQQWLFAVLDAEIFDHFSWAGLVIFGYVAAIALVFAVYRMLLLVSGGRHIAALPAAFAFGCLPIMRFSFTFCRPYYLSCLLMVLEVILLERYRRRPSHAPFFLLPLLSVLQVNLHAAMWPMLLVLLLPYLTESLFLRVPFFARRFGSVRALPISRLALLSALVFLAGFIGPYGFEAMSYGARSYGVYELRLYSEEMQSMAALCPSLLWLVLVPLALDLFLTCRYGLPLSAALLALGTGFMAMLSVRSLLLFLLFAAMPLAYLSPRLPVFSLSERRRPLLRILLLSLPLLALCHLYPSFRYGWVSPLYVHTEQAVRDDARHSAEPAGPVFIYYGGANYFLLEGYDVYLFSSDESFTKRMNGKKEVIGEFLALERGKISLQDFDERYRFFYYVVDTEWPLDGILSRTPGFTCIYRLEDDPDPLVKQEVRFSHNSLHVYRGPSGAPAGGEM